MTISARLDQWKDRGHLSPAQHAWLGGLSRGEPFSLYLELNVLLYAGVLAFVAGLGWTIGTWSAQLGDLALVLLLTAAFAACLWYCFTRAHAWTRSEAPSPNLVFDYVLYLGCLVWSLELAWLENRFHVFGGHADLYLLASAGLFFFLAYRFDNRFVLSLTLASLAAWFGLKISHGLTAHVTAAYRQSALVYGFVTIGAGFALARAGLKPHFLGTWLNVAANVVFWALLSGVFEREVSLLWFILLLAACGASLAWGITRREFVFVVYAAVYGYVGLSAILLRNAHSFTAILAYFLLTGVAMLILLVTIARRFARERT